MLIDNFHIILAIVSKARREQARQDRILDKILARSRKATEYLGCDKIGEHHDT